MDEIMNKTDLFHIEKKYTKMNDLEKYKEV